jgi:hypothetical protein
MKTVLSEQQYNEEFSKFLDETSKTHPRPTTSMYTMMAWSYRHAETFKKKLASQNILWEIDACPEYKLLRDTQIVQSFIAREIDQITEEDFQALAKAAIEEAFGDLTYLDDGYPKLFTKALERKQHTLRRVLTHRGIRILSIENVE